MSEKLYLKYFPFIESEEDYQKFLMAIEQLKDEKTRFIVKSYLGLDGERLNQIELANIFKCTPGVINKRFLTATIKISNSLIEEVDLNSIDTNYLRLCIEKLPSSLEREIISMYLGLNGKRHSQEKIGLKFNFTQSKVSIMISQIKFKLNKIIHNKEYADKIVETALKDKHNQEYNDELKRTIKSMDDYIDREIALKSLTTKGHDIPFYLLSKQLNISCDEVKRRYDRITEDLNRQLQPFMCGNKNFQRYFPQCQTKPLYESVINKITQVKNAKEKEIALSYFMSQPPMTLEEIGQKYRITRQAVSKSIGKTVAFVKDVDQNEYQNRLDKYFNGKDINVINNAIAHLINFEEQEIANMYFGLINDSSHNQLMISGVDLNAANLEKRLEKIIVKIQFYMQTGVMLNDNLLNLFPKIIEENAYFELVSLVSHIAKDNYRQAIILYFGLVDGTTKTIEEITEILQVEAKYLTNFIRHFIATVNEALHKYIEPLDEYSKDFCDRISLLSQNELFNRMLQFMPDSDAIILFLALDLDRCGYCTNRLIASTLHLTEAEVAVNLRKALKIYQKHLLDDYIKDKNKVYIMER